MIRRSAPDKGDADTSQFAGFGQWRWEDSNLRPRVYESLALTG